MSAGRRCVRWTGSWSTRPVPAWACCGDPLLHHAGGNRPAPGDRFKVSSKAVFGLWGIARIKQPSLRKALAAQLAGGSGVADVKIKVRSRWSDVLFMVLTGGLIVPRTVTFEGVVTK